VITPRPIPTGGPPRQDNQHRAKPQGGGNNNGPRGDKNRRRRRRGKSRDGRDTRDSRDRDRPREQNRGPRLPGMYNPGGD
jgi:hypothetical protein